MTVPATTPYTLVSYTGAGNYWTTFPVLQPEDLVVTWISLSGSRVPLILNADYTVTDYGLGVSAATVNITYSATSGQIEFSRVTERSQETDWVNNGYLDLELIEGAFDKTTLILQDIDEQITSIDRINYGYRAVDSMAALLVASIDTKVQTTGFYEPGDGGGTLFYWDANRDKTAHNGGTIIDPDTTVSPGTSGWWTTTSSSGTGCWVAVNQDEACPEQFGAKGDGVTDDYNAFNAALSACLLVTGNNTYNINSKILIMQQNQVLRTYKFVNLCIRFADYVDVEIIEVENNRITHVTTNDPSDISRAKIHFHSLIDNTTDVLATSAVLLFPSSYNHEYIDLIIDYASCPNSDINLISISTDPTNSKYFKNSNIVVKGENIGRMGLEAINHIDKTQKGVYDCKIDAKFVNCGVQGSYATAVSLSGGVHSVRVTVDAYACTPALELSNGCKYIDADVMAYNCDSSLSCTGSSTGPDNSYIKANVVHSIPTSYVYATLTLFYVKNSIIKAVTNGQINCRNINASVMVASIVHDFCTGNYVFIEGVSQDNLLFVNAVDEVGAYATFINFNGVDVTNNIAIAKIKKGTTSSVYWANYNSAHDNIVLPNYAQNGKYGTETVLAGSTTHTISLNLATNPEKIQVTPTWDTRWYVSSASSSSVTITFSTAPAADSTLYYDIA